MMPTAGTADTAVWRDSKPEEKEKEKWRFPWKELFDLLKTAIEVLGPLIF